MDPKEAQDIANATSPMLDDLRDMGSQMAAGNSQLPMDTPIHVQQSGGSTVYTWQTKPNMVELVVHHSHVSFMKTAELGILIAAALMVVCGIIYAVRRSRP